MSVDPAPPVDPSAAPLEPAGFWIRAAARLLDWIPQLVVGFVVGVAMIVIIMMMNALGAGLDGDRFVETLDQTTWIGWIGGVVTAIVYHLLFEGIAGTTFGKRVVGVQVLSMTNGPITMTQAAKRSLAFVVDALFFGAIGAQEMRESPIRQRIGDRWASTRVVKRRSLPVELRTPTLHVVAGGVVAFAATAFLLALLLIADWWWLTPG